jgi:hypothetical protein
MKANFDGIEIEGTPEEIAQIIAGLRNSKPAPVERKVNANIVVRQPVASEPTVNPAVEAFVRELYRYKPDRSSANGRAPYVVMLLSTGETYSIKKLIQLCNGNTTVVSSAIRRAADAGCVIEVTGASTKFTRNTKVRMVSLGTPEEARKVRDSLAPSKDPRTVEYKARYAAKKKQQLQTNTTVAPAAPIMRNSPPITKIGGNS